MARYFPSIVPEESWTADQLRQLDDHAAQKIAALQPPPAPPAPPPAPPLAPYPGDQGSAPPPPTPESPLNRIAQQDTAPVAERAPAPGGSPSPTGAPSPDSPGPPPESPLNGPAQQGATGEPPRPSAAPSDDLAKLDAYAQQKISGLTKATGPDDGGVSADLQKLDDYAQSKIAGLSGKETTGEAPPRTQQEQPPSGPTPDFPGLPMAGGPLVFPGKGTQTPDEARRKILAGEPLTAQDFVSNLTGQASNQNTSTPAALEGQVPGLRLGTGEGEIGEMAKVQPASLEGLGPDARAAMGYAPEAAGAVQAAGRALEQEAPTTRRFYHGTGSAFDRPEPGKFDENGLYGPGYYLTDTPLVADSYAKERATAQGTPLLMDFAKKSIGELTDAVSNARATGDTERVAQLSGELANKQAQLDRMMGAAGPNIRAVNAPQDLNLLNAEAPATTQDVQRVAAALPEDQRAYFLNGVKPYVAENRLTGHDVYEWVSNSTLDPTQTNDVLAQAGYDGVQYAGGKRIPMLDAAGNSVEHTAVAVFPQSLDKLRNALSGTQGGQAEAGLAVNAGGAAAGGTAGYATAEPQQPGESDEGYAVRVGLRTLGGAATGLGASLMATAEGRLILRQLGQKAREAGVVPGLSTEEVGKGATAADWDALARTAPTDAVAYAGIVDAPGTLRQPSEAAGTAGARTPSGALPKPVSDWGDAPRLFRDVAYGSGLSSFTWGKLALGGALETGVHLARDWVSVPFTRSLEGATAPTKAMITSVPQAIGDALVALRTGVEPAAAEAMGTAPKQGYNFTAPLVGGLLNQLGEKSQLPVRAHQANSTFWYTIADQMERARLGALEGQHLGLSGQALADHVQQARTAPSEGIARLAREMAERDTYRSPLGQTGQALASLQKVPYLGPLVAQYVKVPANITARAIDRSPLGLVGTAADVARGVYGTGQVLANELAGTSLAPRPQGTIPLRDRLVNNVIGVGLTVLGATAVADGTLAGEGPDDPNARRAWLAAGNRPDTLRVGGVAVPLAVLGPGGEALGIIARLAEGRVYGRSVDEAGWGVLKGILEHGATSQLWQLQALLNPRDPQHESARENLATRFLPAGGALRSTANLTDPLDRQTGSIPAAVQKTIPVWRNDLPAKTDAFGQPVENPKAGLQAFNPAAIRQPTADPALKTLTDLGVVLRSQPRTIAVAGQQIPLTPDEQRAYTAEYGRRMQAYVAKAQAAPSWASKTPQQQREYLAAYTSAAHAGAQGLVEQGMGKDDLQTRWRAAAATRAARR